MRRSTSTDGTLRDYLSRIWDERAVSRPGWGEGQDAARAVIVMDWHVEYLPKKKVREWPQRWEERERRKLPWFTSKWRAALYKYAKGSGMLTKTAARSIEIEAALATAGEGSDSAVRVCWAYVGHTQKATGIDVGFGAAGSYRNRHGNFRSE